MADTPDDDPELFVSYSLVYLYVNWKQAIPSSSEVAALRRIDPALQDKGSCEVTAAVMGEDWWRLGPFRTEEEANVLEGQLRSAGFAVQTKWQ